MRRHFQGRSHSAADFALDGVGEPPEVVGLVDGREGENGGEVAAPRKVVGGEDHRVCLPLGRISGLALNMSS